MDTIGSYWKQVFLKPISGIKHGDEKGNEKGPRNNQQKMLKVKCTHL